LIAALSPYIDVTTIGSKTYGKYTGSVTLYDSEDFSKEGINPNHFYAMQPLVLEYTNSVGENGKDGYDPDIERIENITNMGVLGDRNEPLLSTAMNDILGASAKFEDFKVPDFEFFSQSQLFNPAGTNLFIERPDLFKASSDIRKRNK